MADPNLRPAAPMGRQPPPAVTTRPRPRRWRHHEQARTGPTTAAARRLPGHARPEPSEQRPVPGKPPGRSCPARPRAHGPAVHRRSRGRPAPCPAPDPARRAPGLQRSHHPCCTPRTAPVRLQAGQALAAGRPAAKTSQSAAPIAQSPERHTEPPGTPRRVSPAPDPRPASPRSPGAAAPRPVDPLRCHQPTPTRHPHRSPSSQWRASHMRRNQRFDHGSPGDGTMAPC